jgi:hypothetical protein
MRITIARVLPIVVLSIVGVAAQGGRLDPTAIQEALDLGRGQSEPGPYTLHMNAVGTEVAGAVYTPFVRIAMASKMAHLQGRELTAADLPDWLTEPIVYIALRWYCVDSDCSLPTQPIDVTIGQPPLTRPLWVSRDFDVLRRFGGEPPSPDIVAVAAFPISVITPNTMVMTCVRPNPSRCDGRAGVITQSDVTTWR